MSVRATSGTSSASSVAPSNPRVLNFDEALLRPALADIAKGNPSPSAKEENLDAKGKIFLGACYGKLAHFLHIYATPPSQETIDQYKGNPNGFFHFIDFMALVANRLNQELASTPMQPKQASLRNFLSSFFVNKILELQRTHGNDLNLADNSMVDIDHCIDVILQSIP